MLARRNARSSAWLTAICVYAVALCGSNAATLGDALSALDPEPSNAGLVINEVQFHDRAGGPDWIELLNAGQKAVDLTSLRIEFEDDVVGSTEFAWNTSCGLTKLLPGAYLIILQEDGKGEEASTVFSNLPSRASDQVCQDTRPGSHSCEEEARWGKCREEWMLKGDFCAKACGRCKTEIKNFIFEKENFSVARCKFNHELLPSGRIAVYSEDTEDEVSWATTEEEDGYSVGKPEGKQGQAMLESLIAETPGQENSKPLTFGPLGGHWGGSNDLLDDSSSLKTTYSSNLPIMIIRPDNGYIPNDPKVSAKVWISGCTDSPYATGDNSTISSVVWNKSGLRCSFKDEPAYNGNSGIELRGRSSQRYPKKQYSMELWNNAESGIDVSLLGMPSNDDWVLGAPYVDRSLMRDALAFDLYMGQGHWAPRMEFVELFLIDDNARSATYDHYNGIYAVKEKIQRSSSRVGIQKMDPANVTDVTGGYIILLSSNSHDSMLSTGEPPKVKLQDEGPSKISFVYPKNPTDAQKSYMSQYVDDFQDALWSPGFSDPVNGYSKYIDIPSWIDYFLHTELSKNLDGYISSVYLHKDKDGKLKAGPAWDYNLAFGQATYWDSYYVSAWDFTHIGPNQKRYSQMVNWYYKLLSDPRFKRELVARYKELRRGPWSDDAVVDYISKYRTLLSSSQARNFGKWPINSVSTNHQYIPIKYWGSTWGANVDGLQIWLLNRLHWMDQWIPQV